MLNVLIPMAGKGSRFSDAGFTTPKPLIEVAGQTLAERSIRTMNMPNARYVFITRTFENPEDNNRLTKIFEDTCKNFIEIRIDSEHLGAAHSALYAEKYIDDDDELIVTNCDQSLRWDSEKFLSEVRKPNIDMSVVLFQSTDPKHSFLKTDGRSIIEIVEKVPVSDMALIGVHYWKKAKYFFESAEKLVKEYKDLGYKEPYVSTSFNYLLKEKTILPYPLSKEERYYPLGTPEDVKRYLNITDQLFLDNNEFFHTAQYGELVQKQGLLKYSIIKNVCIEHSGNGKEISFDKVFLFNAAEKGFYHGVADVLGQYLLLKQMVGDDLVPLYIEPAPGMTIDECPPFMQELTSNLINLRVAGSQINKININEIYVISPRDYQFFYYLFMNHIPEILTEESNPGNTAYVAKLLEPVSQAIIKKIGDVPQVDKKIFLHSSNKWVAIDPTITEVHSRFGTQEQYDNVVKEYEDLGYEIIDPESLTLFEQAALVRSSSHVATVKSSNSIHSIYAYPETIFTMINLSKSNNFPHEVVVKYFINNPIFIERDSSAKI